MRSVHTASAGDQQVSYDMHTTGYLKDIYVHSLDLHLAPLEYEQGSIESVCHHKCKPDLLIFSICNNHSAVYAAKRSRRPQSHFPNVTHQILFHSLERKVACVKGLVCMHMILFT